MKELALLENKARGEPPTGTVPSLQHLLDVISSIIAEEYIIIAKQNPEVFLEIASRKMGQSPSGTVPIFLQNDGR